DPSMPVGGSYTDPDSGVTLSLVSAANGIAEVSVVFDGSDNGNIGTCTVNAPSVTAKAATNNSVAAGDEVQYQVTITNKDSADCSASSFSVNASVPTGWKASSNAITLAAGETGQVMISVVSSVDASDKDYALKMIVTHGEDSSLQTAASVNYSVTTEISPSPELVAIDDQVTMSSKQSVTIDVMANDIVGEQNSASVVSFTRPSKGRLELLSDGTLRYTPEKKFKNNDSFTYTIGDGQSSSTAQVSVKLESSSGGDSGNSGNNGKGKNK
ncbi:Ig-like domain-containing protein, partial [Vibrio diabolicus]